MSESTVFNNFFLCNLLLMSECLLGAPPDIIMLSALLYLILTVAILYTPLKDVDIIYRAGRAYRQG